LLCLAPPAGQLTENQTFPGIAQASHAGLAEMTFAIHGYNCKPPDSCLWPELLGSVVYASTGSNTVTRVTVITLMSSSCPKLCAVLATSLADIAVRTNS
jgi:hypothetical protein